VTEGTPKEFGTYKQPPPIVASRRSHRVRCATTRRALVLRHRLRSLRVTDLFGPALVTALVLISAMASRSPLRDAATHADVSGMRLALSRGYVMLAPFCALLDMQSVLTVPEHIAMLATLLLGFVLWRAVKFARGVSYPVWRAEIGGVLLMLILPLALVVINVLVPRPMARLQVDDPEVVVVDVHAHTASSHDARRDWTQARVREWHEASGFHVAYITDHKRFGGAIDAVATNPQRAGDGVVLLSGLELRSGGQHVNVLSMTQAESVHVVDGDHLTRTIRLADNRVPLIVQTIPFKLPMFAGPGQDSLPRTTAIEINDGAPKGLTTGLKLHAELLQLADSLNLALVAGSDNHGWGRVASGWTLVRVPGWRALTPGALAVRLEETMRGGRRATQVVERRTPMLSGPAVALTIPAMFVSTARGLTVPERVSWIAWAWSTLLWRLGIRRAASRSLARARLARRRRRARMRIVPVSGAPAGAASSLPAIVQS
jgi:predicted metal-dependent phosphoesterase TrpH